MKRNKRTFIKDSLLLTAVVGSSVLTGCNSASAAPINGKELNGVEIGVVSDNQDPDNRGRVKVYFPWISDNYETDWIRVTMLKGMYFLPEIDDEVLIVFAGGDVNKPYVIGSLWSNSSVPPQNSTIENNNIKKITSRSGHEIIFNDDDANSQEKLEIHTSSGHKIVLDDTAGQEKIEIVDKTGGNKITIDSVSNTLDIKSALQLNIKSTNIEIEGTGSLSLKSSGSLKINGAIVQIN